MNMKLLRDIEFWAIKADYFMWSEERDEEYLEPRFCMVDIRDERQLLIFREDPNDERLRIFKTHEAAMDYIASHGLDNSCSMENARPVKVKFNFDTNRWEEMV